MSLDILWILSRLRSRHARSWKSNGKPAIISQLVQVLGDRSVTSRPGFSQQSLDNARIRARALEVLFVRLEGIAEPSTKTAEMREVLEKIIQQAHELTAATDLSIAVRDFTGNPNLKRHLPDTIGKLPRPSWI